MRQQHPSELCTVHRRHPERAADGPTTNGEIQTFRGPVQVRPAPRLHLPLVDHHEGGARDEAE
jgi:hypothetical protein